MSSSVSGLRVNNNDRDSSGEMTEKLGFSVVAAISVTSRFSTAGQHILLGFGEAMHLVDEQHGLTRRTQIPAGLVEHRPDLLDAGGDRGELHESGVALTGDRCCDRGLADARWSPEEDRHGLARGKPAERGSGAIK